MPEICLSGSEGVAKHALSLPYLSPGFNGAKIRVVRTIYSPKWARIQLRAQGFNPDRCIHIGRGLSGCEAISKMLPVGNPDTGWKHRLPACVGFPMIGVGTNVGFAPPSEPDGRISRIRFSSPSRRQ